jgi:hypothetical protein
VKGLDTMTTKQTKTPEVKGALSTTLTAQQIDKWKQPLPQRDYILLDCSGSMSGKWTEALAAVNGYVHSLGSKVNTKILLATFADEYTVVREECSPLSWKSLTKETVQPDGGTALNDAIGRIVARAKKDNPEKAAIVLATDGEECASKELSTEQALALLNECRARGWQVIHLHIGDEASAQAISTTYGIGPNQTIAAGKENIGITLQKVAEKRATYAKSGNCITFSDAEKKLLK